MTNIGSSRGARPPEKGESRQFMNLCNGYTYLSYFMLITPFYKIQNIHPWRPGTVTAGRALHYDNKLRVHETEIRWDAGLYKAEIRWDTGLCKTVKWDLEAHKSLANLKHMRFIVYLEIKERLKNMISPQLCCCFVSVLTLWVAAHLRVLSFL